MKITKIKKHWGVCIDASIDELLSTEIDFLRDLAYESHFLLFKGLGRISDQDMFCLISRFGKPWTAKDYEYSKELSYEVPLYDGSTGALSKFSNSKNIRLSGIAMPWHADIPIWKGIEFPWRCLYNIRNDNPEAGFTSWMSLLLDHISPSQEELDYFSRIKILNQSWHGHNGEEYINNFIKTDPITGKDSLRANYFVSPKWGDKAWIKETYLDNKLASYYTSGDLVFFIMADPLLDLIMPELAKMNLKRDSDAKNLPELTQSIRNASGLINLIHQQQDQIYRQLNTVAKKYSVNIHCIGGTYNVNTDISDKYTNLSPTVVSWIYLLAGHYKEHPGTHHPGFGITYTWGIDYIDLSTYTSEFADQVRQEFNLISDSTRIMDELIFHPDGLHPNRKGHKILYDHLVNLLNL